MKKLFILIFSPSHNLFWEKGYLQKNKEKLRPCKRDKNSQLTKPRTDTPYSDKQINTDTIFALNIHLKDDNQHFETSGASVELEDGTVITDDHVKIACVQEAAVLMPATAAQAVRANTSCRASFTLTMKHGEIYIKRIVKIRLHNTYQKVPSQGSIQIIKYFRCMATLK